MAAFLDFSYHILFFVLGFMASQDYFTHFELSQSLMSIVSGAKTGDPREKTPDHPQSELGLRHVTRARLKPIVVRWRVI